MSTRSRKITLVSLLVCATISLLFILFQSGPSERVGVTVKEITYNPDRDSEIVFQVENRTSRRLTLSFPPLIAVWTQSGWETNKTRPINTASLGGHATAEFQFPMPTQAVTWRFRFRSVPEPTKVERIIKRLCKRFSLEGLERQLLPQRKVHGVASSGPNLTNRVTE